MAKDYSFTLLVGHNVLTSYTRHPLIVFFQFAALYGSLVELNALFVLLALNYCLLACQRYEGGNKGKYSPLYVFPSFLLVFVHWNYLTLFEGKTLFNKWWPLLDLRA